MKRTFVIVSMLWLAPCILVAQESSTKTVEVTRTYDPTLPDANKINLVPRITSDSARMTQNFTYMLRTIKPLSEGYLLNPIPPARVQREAPVRPESFQGYARLGLGFSVSTLLDAYVGGSNTSGFSWSLYANHFGKYGDITNDRKEAVSSLNMRNDIGLNLRKGFSNYTLAFNFGFAPRFVQYYGFDTTFSVKQYNRLAEDSIKQQYLKTYATIEFAGRGKPEGWAYGATVSAYDFRAKNERSEDALRLNVFAEKQVDSLLTFGLAVNNFNLFRSKALAKNNSIYFSLAPYGSYRGDWWKASAKLDLTVAQNDKTQAWFFPTLNFTALLLDDLFLPYLEIKGKYEANSFERLVNENPYISPYDTLDFYETRSYDFVLGIKGRYQSVLSYNVWVDYAILKDAVFFYNTTDLLGNYFNLLYDNGGRFSINGQLTANLSRAFELQASYCYQNYDLDSLAHPLHKPEHLFTLQGRYNLWNKIVFGADVDFRGGYYALDLLSQNYRQRSSGCDVSLNAEYRFFDRSSLFLQLNNLLSSRYHAFNGYNTYGFNVLIGYAAIF
ncbi:hypothetical protein FACS189452_09150 [Bacteroidia bacterium]|nr:hypothetical protein FACS189452_09150 [Bacteroidia bacterium]GHT82140.1 hypothetical protein FACS189467_7130 [Bacteroidia bacterium]